MMKTEEEKTEREEFVDTGFVYAPGSVYHALPIKSLPQGILDRIEIGRLTDFLEYLFEHSQHCDHISQPDAWKEFEEWEINSVELPPL